MTLTKHDRQIRREAVVSLIEHGTHLEALAWASTQAGSGPVLEVGSGYWSTPWLHGWCEGTNRLLLTIETEPDWYERMSGFESVDHVFLRPPHHEIPSGLGEFALALVDGISQDRASWIRALKGKAGIVVVHDTESTRAAEFPDEAEALNLFTNRRDFRRVLPNTSVVWD